MAIRASCSICRATCAGCTILRHYLDRETAICSGAPLQRQPRAPEYPNAVLAAWKRWQYSEATVTIAGDPDAAAAAGCCSARCVRGAAARAAGAQPVFANQSIMSASPARVQRIVAELEHWLARHIEQGFDAESLVLSMLRSGYDATFARDMVNAALAGRHARRRPSFVSPPARRPRCDRPRPLHALAPAAMFSATKAATFPSCSAMEAPRILLLQNLLDGPECDALWRWRATACSARPWSIPIPATRT
jgi:hypothetical protein